MNSPVARGRHVPPDDAAAPMDDDEHDLGEEVDDDDDDDDSAGDFDPHPRPRGTLARRS